MVISYEIFETSLQQISQISYEMTRPDLSVYHMTILKLDFITIKRDSIPIRKHIVDMDIFTDVMSTCQSVITRVVI